MSASVLSIAITGLNAAQAGLLTTSHNISNASTAGYSRQSVEQTTQTPFYTGGGFVGQGTQVATITRAYNQFLSQQLTASQATTSSLQTYQTEINQIDNMLSGSTTGLPAALASFYNGLSAVASDPSSISSRQSALSNAQGLVSNFNDLSQQLQEIGTGVNSQIDSTVATINSLAQQIASLNQQIMTAEGATGGAQPDNDLRDQRDELVLQLNQQVGANVVKQTDGSYSVFFGNGQPLVVGNSAYKLTSTPSSDDPTQRQINLLSPNGISSTVPNSLINGGALGGLIQFQTQTLTQAQNTLGLIALGFSTTLNAQQELGQDLTGNMGTAMFNVPTPQVTPNTKNTGTGSVTASIANVSNMTASDYTLTYKGTPGSEWQLTRLSDGTVTNYAAPTAPATTLTTTDGITIDVSGTPAVGDSFKITPTRNGASDLSLALSDPRNIAAASPVTTGSATTNTGTATISTGSLVASFSTPGASPNVPSYSMSYDLTNKQLQVVNTPAQATDMPAGTVVAVTVNGTTTNYTIGTAPATTGIPYTDGMSMTITPPAPSTGSIQVSFTGTPALGDTFTIGQSAANTTDNRNVVAMGAVQTQKVLYGSTASADDAYSQMVSLIGNQANQVTTNYTTQNTLFTQIQSSVQSYSGVNLDEEAANLIQYQQAYQASAQVIQISSKLFDLLTSLGN
ncbi:MAG TPA: flagellar hook-associated protein FlgK [Rhodocyclaceae bacterium]|nr:flagellar hook-associated protein FlgK [Rhodocyclaceae bacterium]